MIFVDSSAWVALFYKPDSYHLEVLEKFSEAQNLGFATSDYVLSETLAVLLRISKNKQSAPLCGYKIIETCEAVYDSNNEIRRDTLDLISASSSAQISFVDWSNLVLVKKYGLKKILAFDKHFSKMGLEVV